MTKRKFNYPVEELKIQNVYHLYPPLLADEINCSIVQAWQSATENNPSVPVADFLLELADAKSDKLSQKGRAIKLSFTRPEWTELDKIVVQANKDREEGASLGLPEIIRIRLGGNYGRNQHRFFRP